MFKEIIDFIITNYQLFSGVILLVISIIIFILRKKPLNSIETDIFRLVCEGVILAEQGSLKGHEKLDSVVLYVSSGLKAKYPNLDTGRYFNFIASIIETVLSTPQKKK